MGNKIQLQYQIYGILVLILLAVTLCGSFIIYFTWKFDNVHTSVIQKNLVNFQMAVNLENALVNQKGFVSYYYLDRDPKWLKRLGEYREVFNQHLRDIKSQVHSPAQLATVNEIEKRYRHYILLKDQVIDHYIKSETQAGIELHKTVRALFFEIMASCERFKAIHSELIKTASEEVHHRTRQLITSVVILIVVALALVCVFVIILMTQLFDPLDRISREAGKDDGNVTANGALQQLSQNVRGLMKEADQAQAKLKQNREILIQSEKLALVGKLAAGMAHSIRNPLTSVNMRLFALKRTLDLSDSQQEDFDVIAEEIKHLDAIVRNFLEFSRPPKLTMTVFNLTSVVDQSLQLLEHRLKSYNVSASVERDGELPLIRGDFEQLKEVFVNLAVNACESMEKGGAIKILEDTVHFRQTEYVRARLVDSGPGIPESIVEQIFQPFFTTKDEGTGLGLSIAARIVEDHGGTLQVNSMEGWGSTFSLLLPVWGETR